MYSSKGSERGRKQDVGTEEREAGRCIYPPRSSYDGKSGSLVQATPRYTYSSYRGPCTRVTSCLKSRNKQYVASSALFIYIQAELSAFKGVCVCVECLF
jgi:hypothetical protein